jgi:hypothetical protein
VCPLFFTYCLASARLFPIESKKRFFFCILLITIQQLGSQANLVRFSILSQSITKSCRILPLSLKGLQNHHSNLLVLSTLCILLRFRLSSAKQPDLLPRKHTILHRAEGTRPNFRYITAKSDSSLGSPNQTFHFIMSYSRFHVCNYRLSKITSKELFLK